MADSVESNILEVEAEFMAFVDEFNFNLTVGNKSLGKDLADQAWQAIRDRTLSDQEDATGAPLKRNSPAYAARKLKKHQVDKVGGLTGQMLSEESMLGKVMIDDDEVSMAYGTNTKPTKYATTGTIKGDEPTDRRKAEWFTEGGRRFYELDDQIREKLTAVAQEHLDRFADSLK